MSNIQSGLLARVELGDGIGGPRPRVVVAGPQLQPVDVTGAIISAVAHALWQARGGDSLVNWADAEDVVGQMLSPKPAPGASAGTNESTMVDAKPVSRAAAPKRGSSRRAF